MVIDKAFPYNVGFNNLVDHAVSNGGDQGEINIILRIFFVMFQAVEYIVKTTRLKRVLFVV